MIEWFGFKSHEPPKDKLLLMQTNSGSVYAASWVQHPVTGDVAYKICEDADGFQSLLMPDLIVKWALCPMPNED